MRHRMIDMPPTAYGEWEKEVLKRNVGELQEQLQKAYIRIKELTEELDREKNRNS